MPDEITLSYQRQRFCEEYLIDFNATQAAVRAGYSEDSARQQGFRLLKNADIRAYLDMRMSEAAMPASEVLFHLAEIARGSLDDVIDEYGNVDLDKARKTGKIRLIKKMKSRTVTTEESDVVINQVEVYSRVDALRLIGQFHSLFGQRLVIEDWQMRAIEDIKRGVIDYRSLVEAFDEPTATELFTRAGKPLPSE